jgi:Ca-activated chloride channel family protein
MAKTGGGRYFHAADSDGLAQVYAEIDKLEKTEFEETKYSEYTELFRWFAGTGLGLVFVIGILVETRFRSLP